MLAVMPVLDSHIARSLDKLADLIELAAELRQLLRR